MYAEIGEFALMYKFPNHKWLKVQKEISYFSEQNEHICTYSLHQNQAQLSQKKNITSWCSLYHWALINQYVLQKFNPSIFSFVKDSDIFYTILCNITQIKYGALKLPLPDAFLKMYTLPFSHMYLSWYMHAHTEGVFF